MSKKSAVIVITIISLIIIIIGAWAFFSKMIVPAIIFILGGTIMYLLREEIYKAIK